MGRYVIAMVMLLMVAAVANAQVSTGDRLQSVVQHAAIAGQEQLAHGGGLNACGCHFNRKTGGCHCHQPRACGCACQPPSCATEATPPEPLANEERFSAASIQPAIKNRELSGFR